MKIGIDGNEANVENRVGSNVFAYEILRQFCKTAETQKTIDFKIYLKDFNSFVQPLDDSDNCPISSKIS